MVKTFKVTVSFVLGKGKKHSVKGGVNGFWGKHGNKSSKSVKMESGKNMSWEFSKAYMQWKMMIIKRSLSSVKMLLCLKNSMK